MPNATEYFKEVKTEMKKVDWPGRTQAAKFALAVIIVSLLTGAFLGMLDVIFKALLESFVF